MNAPLPLRVSREVAAHAYDDVARVSNEVAGKLAARLASHTLGEVLFSSADRGRYATDASIYQVMPVGVFVPRNSVDVKVALDICRDLKVEPRDPPSSALRSVRRAKKSPAFAGLIVSIR